jgi:hypothetical protein
MKTTLSIITTLVSLSCLPGLANAGITLNGIAMNGITLNGITLNGLALNGLALNGLALNGITLNGQTTNGTSIEARPLDLNSMQVLEVVLPDRHVASVYLPHRSSEQESGQGSGRG